MGPRPGVLGRALKRRIWQDSRRGTSVKAQDARRSIRICDRRHSQRNGWRVLARKHARQSSFCCVGVPRLGCGSQRGWLECLWKCRKYSLGSVTVECKPANHTPVRIVHACRGPAEQSPCSLERSCVARRHTVVGPEELAQHRGHFSPCLMRESACPSLVACPAPRDAPASQSQRVPPSLSFFFIFSCGWSARGMSEASPAKRCAGKTSREYGGGNRSHCAPQLRALLCRRVRWGIP